MCSSSRIAGTFVWSLLASSHFVVISKAWSSVIPNTQHPLLIGTGHRAVAPLCVYGTSNDDDFEADELSDEELEANMGKWDERIARFNSIHLTGRVGNDPEPRYFDDGKVVVNLSLASKRKYHGMERKMKNIKSGEEATDWYGLEIWVRSVVQLSVLGFLVNCYSYDSRTLTMCCFHYNFDFLKGPNCRICIKVC